MSVLPYVIEVEPGKKVSYAYGESTSQSSFIINLRRGITDQNGKPPMNVTNSNNIIYPNVQISPIDFPQFIPKFVNAI